MVIYGYATNATIVHSLLLALSYDSEISLGRICYWFLLPLIGPAISIVTITPNTNTAVTGMPYMLTCTASASDIVWENSTTSLTTETANQITIGGVTNSGEGTYTSILTFVDVRAIHGGVYKCLSNGEETSVVVNIQSKLLSNTVNYIIMGYQLSHCIANLLVVSKTNTSSTVHMNT